MSIWSRIYESIKWRNYPHTDTAVDAVNLGKMDKAIETLDIRVVELSGYSDTASKYATTSESYAVGGTGTRTNEDKDNSKYYSTLSKTYSSNASTYATNAKTQADKAESIAESLDGTIQAMGTITFSELAGKKSTARAGYMWNISDSFTTTSDFKEGAGVSKGAGENVYMTKDGLWDCFAGKDVLSVNGKNGVVSLKADDIPLTVSGTRYDNAKDVKSAVEYISSDIQDVATIAENANATARAENLINWPYYSKDGLVSNGITFTVNDDGSVTANGTATATAQFNCIGRTTAVNYRLTDGKTYTISGCPKGGSTSTYKQGMTGTKSSGGVAIVSDIGNGATFTYSEANHTYLSFYIQIFAGQTVSDLTFYPMLEEGITAHEYQPPYLSRQSLKKKIDETQSMVSDEWESSSTYAVGDYCIYNNSLWKCLVQHSGQTPVEGTYWTMVSVAEEVGALNQSLSHVGMIIHSTTLDTEAKVKAIYGSNTSWSKIEGRFLLGQSSSYAINSTGGEATHTLTVLEMPAHQHQQSVEIAGYDGWATRTTSYMQYAGYANPGNRHSAVANATINTVSAGGSKAHNNMPPYKTVYIWERTA